MCLVIQALATQYVYEITHHRSTGGGECLTAYGNRLVLMLKAIVEYYPKEYVVGLARASTPLFYDNLIITLQEVVVDYVCINPLFQHYE
jgi:hypothetical protein